MATRSFGGALAALALLSSAACAKESTVFPSGVEPWETEATNPGEWPAWPTTTQSPDDVAIQTGFRAANGDTPAHYWAHARVLTAAPIDDVWTALQWQPGAVVAVYPDDTVDCEATNRPEPEYQVSYGLRETPIGDALHRANWFQVNWRANATRDASQALQVVNVRAQKVDGTTYIHIMRESAVITPAPGGGTRLEVVRHINAPDESETTAADWIRLWVGALDAQANGAPLAPLTRCAFP
jgi:hypothetical protein